MDTENNFVGKSVNTVSKTNMIFDKKLGQHILKNQDILYKIVEKAGIQNSDIVLEIGPGTGNLTELLLQKAKKVICIEIDDKMITHLKKRFSQNSNYRDKFVLVKGDAIKTEFPFFNVCVANTPYKISSPLVFKLLAHRPVYKRAILMFQEEFALRCVAKPNSEFYCRLSANIALLAKCDHIMKIGKNNFVPPPKVESRVILLEPKNPLPDINYREWDALLRIVFLRKNKTIGALFKQKNHLNILENNYKKFMKNEIQLKNNNSDIFKMADIEDILTEIKNESLSKKEKRRLKEKEKMEQELDNEDEMETENEVAKNTFKEKVVKILVDNDFEKVRSKTQSVDDFLKLLFVFNKENIHFF